MMKTKTFLAASAALALACGASAPAHAVSFNLIDTGGAATGTQARFGFDIAAAYWSSVLTDNSTINLRIGFTSLGAGILGSTSSTRAAAYVENVYAALAADRTSALDAQAVANLKALTPSATFSGFQALDAITSGYQNVATKAGVNTATTRLDNDGSANNIVLNANTANLKALGFTTDAAGNNITNVVDGSVTFSSNFAFDFDPTNGIGDGSYDFIGVAIHEIGHALGFVSGVDTYDVVGGPNGPNAAAFLASANNRIDEFRIMSILDLYRYSANGLDWSVGGNTWFSIDGGGQLFGDSRTSTGRFNGDGNQASHWKDNQYAPRTNPLCANPISTPIGIMNPTIGACESGAITGLDLAAFDAMGYNVNFDVLRDNGRYSFSTADAYFKFGVPEPATWAMMLAGFGLVGWSLRRRPRVTFQMV
jgi:PEP-CTERM motif